MTHVKLRRLSGKKTLVLLLLVLLAALLWWRLAMLADQAKAAHRQPPVVVVAATARAQDMPIYLTALGTITPTNTVTVHSMVTGQLQQLGFVEGQNVRAGQMLAQLDPRPYQAALTQAEGQLVHDKALLANARIDLVRYQTLLAQNSIAQQQVATQQALVKQYEGTVQTDAGSVASAKVQLIYTRITAPLSGRAGLKQVDIGNIVHTSDTNGVVVITQMQPATVVFSIPEDDLDQVIPSLTAGKKLAVEVWDRDNQHKLSDGVLAAADNLVSATTGTVNLKGQLPNSADNLFPQQFVNVRLYTEVRKNAVVIPAAAMQRGQPGTFVYLIRPDHTVAIRVIVPGPIVGDQLIVQSGLAIGDRVVTDGIDRLHNGAHVILASAAGKEDAGQGGRPHGHHKHQKAASGS
jgi:multidrug efflux system membrane fusion protein